MVHLLVIKNIQAKIKSVSFHLKGKIWRKIIQLSLLFFEVANLLYDFNLRGSLSDKEIAY